jgi:tetratricopeptide (TPR) repeat protein
MGRALPQDVRRGTPETQKGVSDMGLRLGWATICFLAILAISLTACSSERARPRVPLALSPTVAPAAQSHTEQGLRDYQNGQYAEARAHFQVALASAPQSGEAHYNLGLALFALGDTDQAREHFIEAANLAPGNKVIWDSPALRPYGSPEPAITKQTKEQQYSTTRPTFGGAGPRTK